MEPPARDATPSTHPDPAGPATLDPVALDPATPDPGTVEAGMAVLQAMGTARAMRWFRPDPVPDHLVEQVLWAATRASSPNNTQDWAFVVLRDAEVRRAFGQAVKGLAAVIDRMPEPGDPTDRRTLAGARNLAEHIGEVPVIVLVCGRSTYPPHQPQERFLWSALYAASQNLVVAARALGLGAAFTTLHAVDEPAVRRLLHLADDVQVGTTIPLGWPARPFGPLTRRPLAEVVHHDRW